MATRDICAAVFVLLLAGSAWASSNDEIQVYDDAINKPGEMGLDLHMNHVVTGIKQPAWPGDAPSNRSTRLTPEFSYGLSEKWELGAYLPLLQTLGGTRYAEGAKVRIKYMAPREDDSFYWGINQELGWVSLRSAEQHWNVEIRPIFGWRFGHWHMTVNPIIGFELNGPNGEKPDFSPSLRASYEVANNLRLGVEHYAGLGRLEHLSSYGQQSQNTYLVADTEVAGHAVNFGVGKGWNASSDKWTVKAIFGTRF
jgi:hypothetical protein